MARGRMLWGQISISPRVNTLSLKACLLYTWLLAHVDDQGRMSAEARAIKGAVCPMRDDISTEEIPNLLTEIESQGLILRYEARIQLGAGVRKAAALQMMDWWQYQSLYSPQPSKYPPMEGWQDRVGKEQPRDDAGRYTPGAQR